MPSRINTSPRGLLAALGIKSVGQNPYLLLDEVRPQVDLWPQYVQENLQLTEVSTAAVNTIGTNYGNNSLVVPNNQIWWIESLTIISGTVLGAATTYRGVANIFRNYNGRPFYCGEVLTFTTGEAAVWPGPVQKFAGPGYNFGFLCSNYAGVAQTFNIELQYVPLLV